MFHRCRNFPMMETDIFNHRPRRADTELDDFSQNLLRRGGPQSPWLTLAERVRTSATLAPDAPRLDAGLVM
jgi:hypothetical protein